MPWYTALTVREDWHDAPLNEDELGRILLAAQLAVSAYAPPLLAGVAIPEHYVLAQLMQAKNIWEFGSSHRAG